MKKLMFVLLTVLILQITACGKEVTAPQVETPNVAPATTPKFTPVPLTANPPVSGDDNGGTTPVTYPGVCQANMDGSVGQRKISTFGQFTTSDGSNVRVVIDGTVTCTNSNPSMFVLFAQEIADNCTSNNAKVTGTYNCYLQVVPTQTDNGDGTYTAKNITPNSDGTFSVEADLSNGVISTSAPLEVNSLIPVTYYN